MPGERRKCGGVQGVRRGLHLGRGPYEDDVDDRDDDEPGGDRPGRRDARDELRDGDGGEGDERDARPLCDEPVREPGDDPEAGGDRESPDPRCGENGRADRSQERERMRAARDRADHPDADPEHRPRHEHAGK